MKPQLPPRRFTPCTETATEYPVLLIDSEAPLQDVSDVFRVIEYRGFDAPTAA